MSLQNTINDHIKNAMIAKNKEKLAALRAVKSEFIIEMAKDGSDAIDDDVAKEEIDLIKDFAQKWRIEIPELKLTAVCTEVPAFVFIIIPSFASKNVVPRLSPLLSLRTYKVPI